MSHALSITPPASPSFRVADAVDMGDDCFALTLLGAVDATAIVSWPRGFMSDRVEVTAWSSDAALDWLVDHPGAVWDACFIGVVRS